MYRYLRMNTYLKIGYLLALLFTCAYTAVPQSFETIIAYHTNDRKQAEETLLTLKVYLHEKGIPDSLDFSIEKMDDLYVIAIKPIPNRQQRNNLLLLLQPRFSDAFYIREKSVQHPTPLSVPTPAPAVARKPVLREEIFSLKTIDWVWFAIWILAVIGLIASLRNRYKMKHLSRQQHEMNTRQEQMENEIQQLGEK